MKTEKQDERVLLEVYFTDLDEYMQREVWRSQILKLGDIISFSFYGRVSNAKMVKVLDHGQHIEYKAIVSLLYSWSLYLRWFGKKVIKWEEL